MGGSSAYYHEYAGRVGRQVEGLPVDWPELAVGILAPNWTHSHCDGNSRNCSTFPQTAEGRHQIRARPMRHLPRSELKLALDEERK